MERSRGPTAQAQAEARRRGAPRGARAQGAATPTFAVLAIGALLAIPFLMLALLAFTRSPTKLHPYTVPYRQSGRLSYSAEAPSGPTYPGGHAVTGDPLFAHVLNAVDFSFAYRLHAAGRHSLSGSASLEATVVSSDGWHTTLELAPPTRFHGSRALVTGTLDLTSLLALVHSVETATKASGAYTLTLLPQVSASGRVDAVPVHTTFAPKVQFSLTPIEAQPALAGGGSLTTTSPSGEDTALSMFSPSAPGSATGTRSQPASLSLRVGAAVGGERARARARRHRPGRRCAVLAALACLRLVLALVRRDRATSRRASARATAG